MKNMRIIIAILALAAGSLYAQVTIDSDTFGALKARQLGPATMSGRITDIEAVRPDDGALTVWIGAASGGIWKSIDGGLSFRSMFDDYPQSIGDLAIDPQNPDVVWAGTGEANTRNSISVGRGVYRTTDGGDTWTLLGLEDTEHIAKVIVDPTSSDTAYVCAIGHLWGSNEDRGVFKTTDAGKTWEKILYVDEKTGCGNLQMDPGDPNLLYAGMWQVKRGPDFFESGGPGSGLHKSTDGGKTWRRITKGLPDGNLGRIGIGIAPSRPSTLYAVVEAKETAMYRSDDLGESWTSVNTSFGVQARPFYFADVVMVDPTDINRVYKPGMFLAVTNDGGKTFTSAMAAFGGSVHSDHHALWIDPRDRNHLFLGTDGGVYESFDRANHWRFLRSLPVSQFYQVGYDNDWPYNVYGGLQDNGSWVGPSRSPRGIEVRDWENLGGGDGFHAYPDPLDSNIVYFESQGGNILRKNMKSGESKDIKPLPNEGEPEYRFNWNSPIHVSRTNPGTLYFGSQFLFRSRDYGDTWEKISGDLTTNDPKRQRQAESGGLSIDNTTAENNTTIFTIAESPLDATVIWVGTDDGKIQVTRDGGKSWSEVTGNVPGLPRGLWVSSVEASNHDAATGFVTVDGHRSNDMRPYVFRTSDFGKTWESIATDQVDGFAHSIRQDLQNPDLLFVGTEFGLFITTDGGKQWARFTGGLPMVPVHDMQIHPTEHDLIIASHGRGIYILDDITPIRNLTPEAIESDVAVLPSRDAIMVISPSGFGFSGNDEYVGPNPSESAQIVYYLKKRHMFGDLKVEILDENGEVIKTLPGGRRKGINRVDWPMRLPAPKLPPANALANAFEGPRLLEGTYTARLIKANDTFETTVTLAPDPRSPHSAEDRRFQQKTALDLYGSLEKLTWVVESLVDARDRSRKLAEPMGSRDRTRRRLEKFADDVDDFRKTLVASGEGGIFADEMKLRENMGNLYGAILGYEGRPTETQLRRLKTLQNELDAAVIKFQSITGNDLARLNAEIQGKGLEPITILSQEEWQKKREEGATAGGTVVRLTPRQAARFMAKYPYVVPMM